MESAMNQENSFIYTYSAVENREIEEIRKKYLPEVESKMDELKRLDAQVQNSGVANALSVGVGGSLIFGTGMCFTMQVLGSGVLIILLGIFLGIVGILVMQRLEARDEIECLEKGRKVVKVVCPECDHKTSVKMNYCGKCGTFLKAKDDIFEEGEE